MRGAASRFSGVGWSRNLFSTFRDDRLQCPCRLSSGIADAKESSMPDFSKVQPAFSIATANDVAYHDMIATHNIGNVVIADKYSQPTDG